MSEFDDVSGIVGSENTELILYYYEKKKRSKDSKMAEKSTKPVMNWETTDLLTEYRWFKQHCNFTFKGPLASKSEVEKVNYLMTYIGDKGRELYTTFTWRPAEGDTHAQNDTLEGVYAKYEAHVVPQRNEIRATVNFSRHSQGPNERFDNFVTMLRVLVRDCGFADEDRMLRDAIVLRSHSATVREKCLDKGNELTLAMAIQIGQNHEAWQESLKVIDAKVDEDSKVNAARGNHKRNARHTTTAAKDVEVKGQAAKKDCSRCGYPSTHDHCPAENSKCGYCKKQGHWSKFC